MASSADVISNIIAKKKADDEQRINQYKFQKNYNDQYDQEFELDDEEEQLSSEELSNILKKTKNKIEKSNSESLIDKIDISLMSNEDKEEIINLKKLKNDLISSTDKTIIKELNDIEKLYYEKYQNILLDKLKNNKNINTNEKIPNEVIKPLPRGRNYKKGDSLNTLIISDNKPKNQSTTVEIINSNIDNKTLMEKTLSEWKPILARECQVYVYGTGYLAKRWNAINYEFCDEQSAKEILINNLNALLRFKYFKVNCDEVEEYIELLIKGFTKNINTALVAVEFEDDSSSEDDFLDDDFINVSVIDNGSSSKTGLTKLKHIPNSCIAFKNGVFDFQKNDWLFKYDIYYITNLTNYLYMYNSDYVILWYYDYSFKPMFDNINIMDVELSDFIEYLKNNNNIERSLTFELMYNMCYDSSHKYSYNRFKHLCEIMGYLCFQGFSQNFVMLVGEGQNGKNSLFDGCFTGKVKPRPTSNDLLTIEKDKFITGTLLNRYHNIYLETSTESKTYKDSSNLKNITGSQYQTIEEKGVKRYSSYLNCKFLFSANNQDAIKFSDTSNGFRRRINVFEIYYIWDENKKFMKKGDYIYNPIYSDDYHEFRNRVSLETFIYLAMYGIKSATKNFTRQFKFTENDWNLSYSDVDLELKEKIENLSLPYILNTINQKKNSPTFNEFSDIFRDKNGELLYRSQIIKDYDPNINSFNDMLNSFTDQEFTGLFFTDNDIYMNIKTLYQILYGITVNSQGRSFGSIIKKTFRNSNIKNMASNKPYVLIGFSGDRLRIRNI